MNMEFIRKLPIPKDVKAEYPITAEMEKTKRERDAEIAAIFRGESDKLLLVIGPCSADSEDSVLEYIRRLREVQEKIKDKICIIPRIYTGKPRTTGDGYKGMVHQPNPSEKPDALRGIVIDEVHIREGIRTVCWRGRFEKLCNDPLIISDGAHNPEGIAAAVTAIRQYFPAGKVLFLNAVMADKDYPGMIAALAPLADTVFTLTPDNPRALPAAELAAAWKSAGVSAHAFDTPHAAVSAAVDAARERGLPLFSLGSLYMYAEVTEALEALGLLI